MNLYLLQFYEDDAEKAQHRYVVADDMAAAIRSLGSAAILAAQLITDSLVIAVDKRH